MEVLSEAGSKRELERMYVAYSPLQLRSPLQTIDE